MLNILSEAKPNFDFVQIRSLCFNKEYKEIAVISLNGYIHLFNAETFSQVSSDFRSRNFFRLA